MMKECSVCGNVLEDIHENFPRRRVRGVLVSVSSFCRDCTNSKNRERCARDRDRSRAWCKRWADNNKEKNKIKHKLYQEKNRDIISIKSKIRRSQNRSQLRISYLERTYNISAEELMSMMDSQKGCCKICGRSLIYPHQDTSYAVDHLHTTGEVRGLFCKPCNTGIGLLGDSIETLQAAIDYLKDSA